MKRDPAEPLPVSALPLFAQPARPAEVMTALKPHLDAAGVALHVAAGKLHYTAPTGRMSDALRDLLRRHREDLIAALTQTTTEQAPAALPVIQAENNAPAPNLAALEADLRLQVMAAEERIERGENLIEAETDPARRAKYRARLTDLHAQVYACYDQIGALPVDWPFPGSDA